MKIRFSKSQYQYYSSAFKTLAEGVMLGSLAAYFLPEALQMRDPISLIRFLIFFSTGILVLIIGGIINKRGK